ncbi:MAG: hypothetical protein ACXAD7_05445 [Candidatus Kariarchaeaceae archaeon]|jgi:hypothetical protein
MSTENTCMGCGFLLPKRAKKCEVCGAPVDSSKQQYLTKQNQHQEYSQGYSNSQMGMKRENMSFMEKLRAQGSMGRGGENLAQVFPNYASGSQRKGTKQPMTGSGLYTIIRTSSITSSPIVLLEGDVRSENHISDVRQFEKMEYNPLITSYGISKSFQSKYIKYIIMYIILMMLFSSFSSPFLIPLFFILPFVLFANYMIKQKTAELTDPETMNGLYDINRSGKIKKYQVNPKEYGMEDSFEVQVKVKRKNRIEINHPLRNITAEYILDPEQFITNVEPHPLREGTGEARSQLQKVIVEEDSSPMFTLYHDSLARKHKVGPFSSFDMGHSLQLLLEVYKKEDLGLIFAMVIVLIRKLWAYTPSSN